MNILAKRPLHAGILLDGTLYVAGFSGEGPQTGAVPRDFEAEVKQAPEKIGVILKAADMQYSDVVSVQVYLTDMKLFERMNAVYRHIPRSLTRRARSSASQSR